MKSRPRSPYKLGAAHAIDCRLLLDSDYLGSSRCKFMGGECDECPLKRILDENPKIESQQLDKELYRRSKES